MTMIMICSSTSAGAQRGAPAGDSLDGDDGVGDALQKMVVFSDKCICTSR